MGNLNDDVRERCVHGKASAPSNDGRPSNLRRFDLAEAAPGALRAAYSASSPYMIGRLLDCSTARFVREAGAVSSRVDGDLAVSTTTACSAAAERGELAALGDQRPPCSDGTVEPLAPW